ncbi:MAG: RelA/SpoT family protein [Alphaproteobacteria bacterium]|nr:RelA/SpoT family protein [Alphaproteobacteria bacterium]
MEIKDFFNKLEDYKDKLDINLIAEAAIFAENAHQGQLRKSNEPYITHPLNVAYELMQYNFDTNMIVASLLHDVIEDTDIAVAALTEQFGEDITAIVVGLTKLAKYSFTSMEEEKVENLRKFILSFIEDIRVLIIKIFDRLDNIRTLKYIEKVEKRKRIARETLDIYAPLAQRLALNSVKDEMEDLCFEVLHPEIRASIISKTQSLQKALEGDILRAKNYIIHEFEERGIKDYTIVSRVKHSYSTWRKMQKKRLNFEEISDLFGFRIILQNVEDCYIVLGILHGAYKARFDRFKDYISYPKPNNYRSLHTGVILDGNKVIEFQIRTQEMDYFNEKGISSHWNYKNSAKNKYDVSQYSWLQNLANIVRSDLALDYVYEYSKMQMFNDEVFIFTPQDEIISLQRGATALDFAYGVHSEIGNQFGSAIINGIHKPLFTVLHNGDKVEILRDINQEPKISWLSFVKTPAAKIAIRKYLNQKYKKEISQQAISLIEYVFNKENLQFHVELIPKILEALRIKSEQTLYDQVLEGKLDVSTIINSLYPQQKINSQELYDNVVVAEDFPLGAVYLAECCCPVYGDAIVGALFPSNKIEVHHESCKNLFSQLESLSKINVKWLEINQYNKDYHYRIKVSIILKNVVGSLMDASAICFKQQASVLDIYTEDIYLNNEFKKLNAILLVNNKQHAEEVIAELNKSPYIKSAERLIGN